jgi:peptidoglycan-associated lipoprotein
MKTKPARWFIFAFLLVGTLSFVNACKKKPPTTTAEARPSEAPTTPGPREVAPPPRTTPAPVQGDVMSESLEQWNRAGYLKDVFFDYDKADLRDDARTALSTDADWLKRYSSAQLVVEGHCDDRGTSEYNLALGDRRANAVREYLGSLGIDAGRVKTVSYGKERPFCSEENESCWQQNRRGHFVFTAK